MALATKHDEVRKAPLSRWISIWMICWTLLAYLPYTRCFVPSTASSRRRTTHLSSTKTEVVDGWFPAVAEDDDDDDDDDEIVWKNAFKKQPAVEQAGVVLVRDSLLRRLEAPGSMPDILAKVPSAVQGRFMDLTCSEEGEWALESLFVSVADDTPTPVLQAAVMALQSVCVMGTQVGVKGPPSQLRQMVAHLDARNDPSLRLRDLECWDSDSVRRLKHRIDRMPALALMASLSWKRTPQGAFDLLVASGAWTKHENLALLRSGFPLRFSRMELEAARKAYENTHDPDTILGLRRDLRDLKVYTVDSASTSEIDDGLSVQEEPSSDGTKRQRIWVHIADAERWAPLGSPLCETGRKRITSLYLPSGSVPMFPDRIGSDLMSLKANHDTCALSLGVLLNDDGSIDVESIEVMPSVICVDYRLTYDDVDEMLEEGIGYSEEWQLGALLAAALKRRRFRISNDSSESMIPNPIPYSTVSTFPDLSQSDNVGISLQLEVSHNAGQNRTAGAENEGEDNSDDEAPVSSAYLLVTEMMIMAGEAMGQYKTKLDVQEQVANGDSTSFTMSPNLIRLPYRTQPKPDYRSRARERRVMLNLLENNVGNGLCHAWYSRRFLLPVKVSESRLPHSGLGLSCYVQWTSPIRRFSDLQVHAAVKRNLRRRRVYELLQAGKTLPDRITFQDLGIPPDRLLDDGRINLEGLSTLDLDKDINFLEGAGLIGASRKLQRQSIQFWQFEYIRRLYQEDPDVTFRATVLGCVDPEKQQYAIYVHELGMEHRYTSPGRIDLGAQIPLKVANVSPRSGQLSFVRVA